MKARFLLLRLKANYHWVTATMAFLAVFVVFGISNNLSCLYLIPMTRDLGISRSAYSIAFSMQGVVLVISNLTFSAVYLRFGFRKTTSVAIFITALTYVVLSRVRSIAFLIATLIVQGLVSPFCGTAGISSLIAAWFQRHRGMVLGVVMAASGFGSSLFSVVIAGVTDAYDWRTSLLVSAALLTSIAIIITVASRDAPSKMGLTPLGEGQDITPDKKKRDRQENGWEGFPLGFLKTRYYFYLFFIAFAMSCSMNYGISPVIVAYFQDCGFSAAQAAAIQSIRYLALAFAKIAEGMLCDRFGSRPVLVVAILCGICGTVLLVLCPFFGMAMAGSILLSVGLSINTIVISLLIMDMFGSISYGALLGISSAMVSVCGIIAMPAVNAVYDSVGTYCPAFIAIIVVLFLSLALYLVAFHGSDRDRGKRV